MDGVKKTSRVSHSSSVDHRTVQKSTTLNRKFVKKPVARPRINASVSVTRKHAATSSLISKQRSVKLSPTQQKVEVKSVVKNTTKAEAQKATTTAEAAARIVAKQRKAEADKQATVQRTQIEKVTRARMAARTAAQPQLMSAQEMKDRAVQQALRKVSRMEQDAEQNEIIQPKKLHFWQKRKFVAASAMAVVSVAMLGYLVYLNLPDLSARVSAMRAGIENSYPSYVPSSFKLDGLVDESDGKIVMTFKDKEGKSFTLTEEKSSWDSAAVLTNYVQENWEDYSIAKGQGLTIYVYESKAVWVNGGVFYSIDGGDSGLTSSELHDIAVSL